MDNRSVWLDLVVLALPLGITFVIWLAGMLAAIHLGITSQRKRIVSVGFVFPLAIASGAIGAGVLFRVFDGDFSTPMTIVLSAMLVVIFVITYYSVFWIIRGSQMDLERKEREA